LIPSAKDGNLKDTSAIGGAKDIDLVDLVTVTDKGILLEARAPEEFVQVECDRNGVLVYDKRQSLKDLYQLDSSGTLVVFDKQDPKPGVIFGLISPNDENAKK